MRQRRALKLNRLILSLTAVAGLLLPAHAQAVQPERWLHTTEADFEPGQRDQTVVTNLGDLRLASGSSLLSKMPGDASILNDVQELDGVLYLAGGPRGELLAQRGESVETITQLPEHQVFALAAYQGQLLVGLSGNSSRLAVLADGELQTVVELEDVRYIWDLAVDEGRIYAATGTEGKLLLISPDGQPREEGANGQNANYSMPSQRGSGSSASGSQAGGESAETSDFQNQSHDAEPAENEQPAGDDDRPAVAENLETTVILDSQQTNILTLARDADRRVYAGTDTEGLVYRLTRQDGNYQPYVLYDAPEPEIGALLVTEDGTVFAGTADAEQAKPGRLEEAVSEQEGRPVDEEGARPGDAEDIPQVPPEAGPIGEEDDDGGDGDGGDDEPAPGPSPDPEPNTADQSSDAMAPQSGQPQNRAGGDRARQRLQTQSPAQNPDQGRQEASRPSPEQLDQLREVVRDRLDEARQSGEMQVGTGRLESRPSRSAPSGPSRSQRDRRSQPDEEGNAIYRISSDGFVHEVFRESVMVLDIAAAEDRLLVATGNQGQVYSVDRGTEETTIVGELEAEQVTTVVGQMEGDGTLLATANPARLIRMAGDVADRGTYTSPVLDASQVSLWGVLRLMAEIPEETSLAVETRTGNVGDPDEGTWSGWSDPQAFMPDPQASPLQPHEMELASPPARFLQYRLTFFGRGGTTPIVKQIELAYVMPNLAPTVSSLTAEYEENSSSSRSRNGNDGEKEPEAVSTMNLEWEARDPNEDRLTYRIEYRRAGSERWMPVEEGLNRPSYDWQTRHVPDGRYVLRVTAFDRRDNPGDMARTATRQSRPVVVDNTAPRIEVTSMAVDGNQATLSVGISDDVSPIKELAYRVNGKEPYEPVLPEDMIFDSTAEQAAVTINGLSPGQHVVTLRALDDRGNPAYESVSIQIEP
jgi:hypothetical protein